MYRYMIRKTFDIGKKYAKYIDRTLIWDIKENGHLFHTRDNARRVAKEYGGTVEKVFMAPE